MNRVTAFIFVIAAVSPAGCASTGATPRPFPTPVPPPVSATASGGARSAPAAGTPEPPAPGAAVGYGVAGTALSLRGTPYRNGGSDPAGFDCSGFVRYVFGQNGVTVPRTVTEQYHAGSQVVVLRA